MKAQTTYKDTDIVDEEDISSGEIIQEPFSPSDISISTPPTNMGDLIDMIEHGRINFGTDYQREENLWTPGQQSRLIESILLGLRLPAFYFEVVEKRKWNIIDGLQRCCAIRNFCVDQTLSLTELEFLNDKFEGKKYSDFTFDIKSDVRMLPITVNLLGNGTPDKVKYILFKRLNTGGIELTPQEIRNAVYSGIAIDTISKMANDDAFKDATGYKIPTKRKQDMDFVSRFVAFYITDYKKYQPDLERFINNAMEIIKKGELSSYDINKMENSFHRSMLLCKRVFGDMAFRKQTAPQQAKRPLNKAIFEVMSVLFSKLTDKESENIEIHRKEFIEEFWNTIKENSTFSNSFSEGTGMSNSVKNRFSITENIMNKYK